MTALTTRPSDLRVHDEPVTRPKRLARIAGVLYLTLAILGGLAQLYVRPRAIVPGDAAATAANVATDTRLFQWFFAGELVSITAFLLVAMALYRLLRHVNPQVAAAMVIFVAVAAAVMSLNMLNHYAALTLATNTGYIELLGAGAADAWVLLFLELHNVGWLIASTFFALWLLPLGYLAYRSGYFPRTLSVLLMFGCFSYLAEALPRMLFVHMPVAVEMAIAAPAGLAELWMIAYLLIRGVKTPTDSTLPTT